MESSARIGETPKYWEGLNEANFVLAMRCLGELLGRYGAKQADLTEVFIAHSTAVIAADVIAEARGVEESDTESRMDTFLEGLQGHGGPDVFVPTIIGSADAVWRQEIWLANTSINVDPQLKLERAEILHALVHGDPEVTILIPPSLTTDHA